MEFTLLWAALTAAALGWFGTRLWPDGLPDLPADRLLGAGAIGLLVGRISAMIAQGTNPLLHPGDLLLVRGGVDTAGATIGAVAAYLWSVRGEIRYLDAITPAALLALAGWHGGCLWRGACLGTASDLPWAVAEPGSVVSRHPVELYAALALVAAAWTVARLSFRPLARSGLGLVAVGMVRLLTEPMRLSLTGGATGWYIAAIAVGLVAALVGPRLLASPSRAVT
ncbi:MAG TPA: prolipoprotein diacylglyceryl transferase family protein [Acidimicrobiia bacterium]|nr:prolipoprotein diacylglyceryl transferase family protein [Acidimicrobiia bacterium]